MGRGASSSRGKYMQCYQDRDHTPSDPWSELANAVVAQAADDYRRLCQRLIKNGVKMSGPEYRVLQGRIREIEVFFKSDWGFLLSHGLAKVIWEKLEGEFAEDIKDMEAMRETWIASEEKRIEDEARARREAQHKEMVEAIFRDAFTEVYGEECDES